MGHWQKNATWKIRLSSILIILGLCSAAILNPSFLVTADNPPEDQPPGSAAISLATADSVTYIPLLVARPTPPPALSSQINVPFFNGDVVFDETAVFWFGQVTPSENYADVRVGYNSDELWVHVAVFDRRLWYMQNPQIEDMTDWDAVSLFVQTAETSPTSPTFSSHQFVGQLTWWEPRDNYQAAYRGTGLGWQLDNSSFTTQIDWRGDQPNNDQDDRGWWIQFHIPFTSLGLSGPPPTGAQWRLGISLHDRDALNMLTEAAKVWPVDFSSTNPDTWGFINFGLPNYLPPANVRNQQMVTIRHGLENQQVKDGMVGGNTMCANGIEYWTEWGQTNYDNAEQINIQNEYDVSDWPCFSKYYITFPLNTLPSNKEILSAELTMWTVGNAGGGQWGDAPITLVQVMTVEEDFTESGLTWNNAPMVTENVSRAWVPPITEETWVDPGVPRSWDLSYAVYKAYTQNTPLRLVLYMADGGYNTGRYFWSSDVGDWNAIQRPTLQVILGDSP